MVNFKTVYFYSRLPWFICRNKCLSFTAEWISFHPWNCCWCLAPSQLWSSRSIIKGTSKVGHPILFSDNFSTVLLYPSFFLFWKHQGFCSVFFCGFYFIFSLFLSCYIPMKFHLINGMAIVVFDFYPKTKSFYLIALQIIEKSTTNIHWCLLFSYVTNSNSNTPDGNRW